MYQLRESFQQICLLQNAENILIYSFQVKNFLTKWRLGLRVGKEKQKPSGAGVGTVLPSKFLPHVSPTVAGEFGSTALEAIDVFKIQHENFMTLVFPEYHNKSGICTFSDEFRTFHMQSLDSSFYRFCRRFCRRDNINMILVRRACR